MNRVTSEVEVRRSVVVEAPVERAFRVFTEGIGSWWPFAHGHSVFGRQAETAVVERRVGGRVYERSQDGEEALWGTLSAWEPPHRFVMTWHPGREEDTAQELEVRFSPAGEGTRVEVVHTGWERVGAQMEEAVAGYDEGWEFVLGRYAEAAGKES